MVFRKRGQLKQNEQWRYDGITISVVDDFNYLGVVFSYDSSFHPCFINGTVCGNDYI